jgi:hypothetical protein
VSFFCVFFINQCNARSLTIGFSSDYSAGRIDCMEKSNKCFKMNPDAWRAVNGYGLQLLSRRELERYRDKFSDKKDLQDEWKKAVTHPGEYINLLVGQLDNKDLRAERDEENHYDSEPWDWVTKNFFLAYHQVRAQVRWFASRPNEAEHYKRFQIMTCV